MAKRPIDLRFPVKGVQRKAGYQKQPPFAARDADNVRSEGTLEELDRGGSRPGLTRVLSTGTGKPVNMIGELRQSQPSGSRAFFDEFNGSEPGATWTAMMDGAPSISGGKLQGAYDVAGTTVRKGIFFDVADFDGTDAVSGSFDFTSLLVFDASANDSTHDVTIHFGLDPDNPQYDQDGLQIVFEATQNGSGNDFISITFEYWEGGTRRATTPKATYTESSHFNPVVQTLTFSMDSSGNCTAFWENAYADITLSAVALTGTFSSIKKTGVGISLGMDAFTHASSGAVPSVTADNLSLSYGSTSVSANQNDIFAASNGYVYKTSANETLALATTSPTELKVHATDPIATAEINQKLYIADMGLVFGAGAAISTAGASDEILVDLTLDPTDYMTGDGNNYVVRITDDAVSANDGFHRIASFTTSSITLEAGLTTSTGGDIRADVYRSPKYFDNSDATIKEWQASAGTFPYGCTQMVRWNGRIVLAGDPENPQIWYMSRQTDPTDFDYSAVAGDVQGAVAGTSSEYLVVGERITALMPGHADAMMFGCDTSLWLLRGDPRRGGRIDRVSGTVGVVGPNAWCFDEGGTLYFLSRDGLYAWQLGGSPEPITSELLPLELVGYQYGDSSKVLMDFDPEEGGIHIYAQDAAGTKSYWWVDLDNGAFWPVSFNDSNHNPSEVKTRNMESRARVGTLLGGQDGNIRMFTATSPTDDGSIIRSYVDYGPFRTALSPLADGRIDALTAEMDEDSGDVLFRIRVGETAEGAVDTTTHKADGRFSAGLSTTHRPRVRGSYSVIRMEGTGTDVEGSNLGQEAGDGLMSETGENILVEVTADSGWACDSLVAEVARAGRKRKL